MASAKDVAAFIYEKLGPVSAYKLHKLVYYAQAWSVAWDGRPLFPESIKAWTEGPVTPELWHAEKHGQRGSTATLSQTEVATITAVLDFYGAMSPNDLISLSHREAPWRDARVGVPHGAPSRNPITIESMKRYYGPCASSGEKRIPDSVRRGVQLLLATPEDAIGDLLTIDPVDGERALEWLETGEGDPWAEELLS